MTIYEKFCQLDIDSRLIGLEKSGDMHVEYFCTPVDARIIGWENSIHYCFMKGSRDMVFAVNPEPAGDQYVYPLAMNFRDFLSLILSCGSTTAIEQIIGWSRQQFEDFVISEYNEKVPGQQEVLDTIASELKIKPMEDPYSYVKNVQQQFQRYPSKIRYSNEYYDTLGLERPDGSENEMKMMEFAPVQFTFVKKK